MTALIDRVGFDVDAIDVFCGYGGSSQGIHAAGATVIAAANHSELALECHAANFPDTDHWQADMVDANDPQVMNRKGKKVAGKYLDPAHLPSARFAWFSPSCTHHSQANAKKIYERGLQTAMFEDEDWDEQAFINSERARVTMSCVLRYARERHPEIVCVENVLEVTTWGPGRDGSSFRHWMTELTNLGYEVHCCFFNSMFFPPCPQSRDRIYIVAWRKGNTAPDLDYRPVASCTSDRCGGKIVNAVQTWKPRTRAWRLPQWGKYGQQYFYACPDCESLVHPGSWMALHAVDWSNLGPTLEDRIAGGNRPADSTWERIRRAVQKYRNAPPVILSDDPEATAQAMQVHVAHAEQRSSSGLNRSQHVGEATPTVSQKNSVALAQILPMRSGRPRADHPGEPTATVMAEGSHLAIAAMVKNHGDISEAKYRAHHASEAMGSIVASSRPQSVLALIVPNRTTSAATDSQAVVVTGPAKPGETRPRHATDPMFTKAYGVASTIGLRGDHSLDRHLGEPATTVSAGGNHLAIVTALFTKLNGGPGDTAWHEITDSLNTITGRDTTGFVVVPWIDHWISDPVSVTEQLATITARMRHTLASIEPSDEPITDDMLMQVRFRMLQPDPELRRAMAFGADYILLGNKTQMTAGLGNAVTPPVANWITERCLATLRGDGQRRAA